MLVTPPTHHVVMFPYTSKAVVGLLIQASTAVKIVASLKFPPVHGQQVVAVGSHGVVVELWGVGRVVLV